MCFKSIIAAITSALGGPGPGGAVRDDIFTPGNSYYFGITDDFNAIYDLNPGDTVLIPAGTYPSIDVLNATGITFKNSGGLVTVGHFNLGPKCKDCKILGNGYGGVTYGIRAVNASNFGFGLSCTGNIEVAWVESIGNVIGIQLVGEDGPAYAVNVQNLHLHDCRIQEAQFESVYLGYYIVGGIYMTALVERIDIVDSGSDGIQCRNGYFEIYDCTGNGIGLTGDSSNAQFILFGGNTNGGIAKRNYGRNVHGYGIFCNGWGDFLFECNDIESAASSIFTKNYEYAQDLQGVGHQTITERNNTLVSTSGVAFEHYYHDHVAAGVSGPDKPVTVTALNNRTAGTPNIESGASFTSINNGAAVVPSCP